MEKQTQSKSFLKKVLEWYVYGSFHVAIMTGFYITFTYLLTESKIDWNYIIFTCLGTHVIYSMHRIIALDRIKNYTAERFHLAVHYRNHILVYTALSIIGMIYLLSKLSLNEVLLIIIPGIISVLYILPVFKNKRRLRDMPYVKVFLIASCYSFLCTFVPLSSVIDLFHGFLFFLSSVFFIFAITLTFDIRDVDVDNIDKVETIATHLGAKNTIKISIYFLFISCILFCYTALYFLKAPHIAIITFCILVIVALISILSSRNKSDYYYTLWMDGILALPAIIYMVLK